MQSLLRLLAGSMFGFALLLAVSDLGCGLQAHFTKKPHRPSGMLFPSLFIAFFAMSAMDKAYGSRAAIQALILWAILQGSSVAAAVALGAWVSWRAERLEGAMLAGANLEHRSLRAARLRGANLAGANLHVADLRDADMTGANLRGANLRGALLLGVTLDWADLRDADLRESVMYRTSYQGVKSSEGTQWPDTLYPADIPKPTASRGRADAKT